MQSKIGRRVGIGICSFAFVVAVSVPAALGHSGAASFTSTTPKLIGNPIKGKVIFISNCGTCHTLKQAGTLGNIGPNLNKLGPSLTEATIIKQINNGGSSLMSKAAAAKYTTQMVGYKNVLKVSDINNAAAFVYVSTHPTK